MSESIAKSPQCPAVGDAAEPCSVVAIRATAACKHAPDHCALTCMDGDPRAWERGCAWLRGVIADRAPAAPSSGNCERGYCVDAAAVEVGGERIVAITVRGELPKRVSDSEDQNGVERALVRQCARLKRESERVVQLVIENEHLASEVLNNYEQLSLLFDFTSKIAEVTQPEHVEQLLITRLGKILRVDTIEIVNADDQWRSFDFRGAHAEPVERNEPVAPDSGGVVAAPQPTASVCMLGDRQVLIGVLPRLEHTIDLVLASRPKTANEFTSGDVRLLESLLTFGGQLISNSRLHERLRRVSIETTRALVDAIDKKDRYTSGHSERVGFLAHFVGTHLNLAQEDLVQLEWAGLLHDVGKIGVPEEILNKPGKLTDEEFDIIKKHPEMGYEILRPIRSFEHILDGVLFHHENPDGSGYPRGLRGEAIPLFARILHVVDVFDALSSQRSYRSAFTVDRALRIIREEAGEKLDAEIAEIFLREIANFRENQPDVFEAMFPGAGREGT